MLYKEYVVEELLSSIITYDEIKTYYPIQVNDLRFQVDYVTPKIIKLHEEYDEDPTNTNLYVTLIERREIKKVSDGIKFSGVEFI